MTKRRFTITIRVFICIFLFSAVASLLAFSASFEENPSAEWGGSSEDFHSEIESILSNFYEICKIPHPSGDTEEIASFYISWAENNGFSVIKDEFGNVIIDCSASSGYETAPLTILQTHMDMVYVNDSESSDKTISPVIYGNELRAENSSLGADDGIGCAIVMEILTSDTSHGPLRWIITNDEETDLSGAKNISSEFVEDASYFICVDLEQCGYAIIRSAACYDGTIERNYQAVLPSNTSALSIDLSGLQGGHSAVYIAYDRLNSIKTMASFLNYLDQRGINYEISSVYGGSATNAIPTDCTSVITVEEEDIPLVETCCSEFLSQYQWRYSYLEPSICLTVEEADFPEQVLSQTEKSNLLSLLDSLYNGVYDMDTEQNIPSVSTNLGVIEVTPDNSKLQFLARSADEEGMEEIVSLMKSTGKYYGYTVSGEENAIAWNSDHENSLIPLAADSYRRLTGDDLVVSSTHAALECGYFSVLNPNMDILAIGPTVYNAHSTQEVCYINTIPIIRQMIADIIFHIEDY